MNDGVTGRGRVSGKKVVFFGFLIAAFFAGLVRLSAALFFMKGVRPLTAPVPRPASTAPATAASATAAPATAAREATTSRP